MLTVVDGNGHGGAPGRDAARQLAAEHALCRGDVEPRLETWSHLEPVTLFGAAVPIRVGWDELAGTFSWLADHFSDPHGYEFDLVAAGASGDLAYTVGFERMTVVVDDGARTDTLRVTHVYRREDGHWKIVHRHGDHLDGFPRPLDATPEPRTTT